MKKVIKYSLLASLLTVSCAFANSSDGLETPPSRGDLNVSSDNELEIENPPSRPELEIGIPPEVPDDNSELNTTCSEELIYNLTENIKDDILNNPSNYGLVTMDEMTEATSNASKIASEIQKQLCFKDPESCGINVSKFLSQTYMSELSTGWTLIGTSFDINSTDLFSETNIVWAYKDGSWFGYSPESDIQNQLEEINDVQSITNIPANSGIWVRKK